MTGVQTCALPIYAQCAADAPVFVDPDHAARRFEPVFRVEWERRLSGQCGQSFDTGLPTGRTLVDASFTLDQRAGIAGAVRVAATRALRLRQGVEQVLLETQARRAVRVAERARVAVVALRAAVRLVAVGRATAFLAAVFAVALTFLRVADTAPSGCFRMK